MPIKRYCMRVKSMLPLRQVQLDSDPNSSIVLKVLEGVAFKEWERAGMPL